MLHTRTPGMGTLGGFRCPPAMGLRRRSRLRLHAGAGLVLVAALVSGCSVTPERIARWKTTQEGREKLVAALGDRGVPVERRAEAAAALTEVGWVDRVEATVAGLPFDDRARVIPAIAPLVARDLGASDAGRAGEAREALYGLRRQATTLEGTRSIDEQLLPALERDLRAARAEAGRHSVKEMLIAIGPLALPVAARVVADPRAPFEAAVEVIDKLGDKAAHEAAGAALVDRVKGGAVPTPTPALWQALGTMGGPKVVAFVQEKIRSGSGNEPVDAARTLNQVRRDRALLPFALEIARDVTARPAVREQMLTLAQALGGEDARKGLVALIASEPDAAFRFKVFETTVKGDAKAILPALEAFPADRSYDPAAVRQHLVAPLTGMGWPAREGIFKALQSRSPLARMTAVLAVEKIGFDSDAAQVAKLSGDRAKVKGFPTTIGAEATRISAALKKPAS
jgi:hypothetical protein